MKLLILILFAYSTTTFASDTYVNGYTKKDGTYVQPHYKTHQDNSLYNNYSTQGNVNPYTGKPGTKDPNKINPYGGSNGYGSGNNNND